MNQQPQSSPQPSDTPDASQRRLDALALPLGALFLVLAVTGLSGGETSITSSAFFPIGAALLLMSTRRWWKPPAAARDENR
jgi:hypothetical protein